MMGLSLVSVGAKITATIVNAIINAVNAGGLSIVAPSSVTGTGSSVTALGKVAFTTATSVSVNGCFTGTYDNYLVKIDCTMSGLIAVTMNLRSAGTDNTSAFYDTQTVQGTGTTTPVSGQVLAGTAWAMSAASQALQKMTLELDGPFLSAQTVGMLTALASPSPPTANTVTALRQVTHRAVVSYDGFTLTATSGTMTGVLRIYGYNNG